MNAYYLGAPDGRYDYHRYTALLIQEIERFFEKRCEKIEPLQSLLLERGFGNFPPSLLLDIIGILTKNVGHIHQDAQISLELGYNATSCQLRDFKAVGINRLNRLLLDRGESRNGLLTCLEEASGIFDTVGVDFYVWLPECLKAPLDHVSLSFKNYSGRYLQAAALLEAASLRQYTAYDFAREGKCSRSQLVYRDGLPYQGFGLGACSRSGDIYTSNPRTLRGYEAYIHAGKTYYKKSILQASYKEAEQLMQALSTTYHYAARFEPLVQALQDGALVKKCGDGITFTARGFLMQHEIVTRFLMY